MVPAKSLEGAIIYIGNNGLGIIMSHVLVIGVLETVATIRELYD